MVPTEIKPRLISVHQAYETPDLLLERYKGFLQPHRRSGLLAWNLDEPKGGKAFDALALDAGRRLNIPGEFPVMIAAFLNEEYYAPGSSFTAQRFFGGLPSLYEERHKFWCFENREFFFGHLGLQFTAHGEFWAELARRELNLARGAPLSFSLYHFSITDAGREWWRTLFSLIEHRDMSEL